MIANAKYYLYKKCGSESCISIGKEFDAIKKTVEDELKRREEAKLEELKRRENAEVILQKERYREEYERLKKIFEGE